MYFEIILICAYFAYFNGENISLLAHYMYIIYIYTHIYIYVLLLFSREAMSDSFATTWTVAL